MMINLAKRAVDSISRSVDENGLIVDGSAYNDSSHCTKLEKVRKDKVMNEDSRQAVEKMLEGKASLPENWNDLPVREQRDWVYEQIRVHWTNVPESMIFLLVGNTIRGDCDPVGIPDWLDRQKFLRGQRFGMDNFSGMSAGQLLSLPMLFSFKNSLKPLIFTGKSGDPFTSFKRYLSTAKRLINWYSSDVWTEGTNAYMDMQTVRKLHANVKKKMINSSREEIEKATTIRNSWSNGRTKLLEDFRTSCPAPARDHCPHMLSEDDQFKKQAHLSQAEMSATQFGFLGLVILFPEKLGIHGASDEDLDAFCHLWRGLGYLLGIEDEFNFCNGTLEEIKQRSRDFVEYWVKRNLRDVTPEWEHMTRCVVEGIKYYYPGMSYETNLLYLAELLEIRMPRLRASLSHYDWVCYNLMKVTFHWIARIPGVPAIMKRHLVTCIERAVKFTEKELAMLQKRSDITLSKGIAETKAFQKDMTMTMPISWYMTTFFAFLFIGLAFITSTNN